MEKPITTILVNRLVSDGDYFILEPEILTEEQYLEILREQNRQILKAHASEQILKGQAFGL